MPYCNHCGKPVSENDKFCNSCGKETNIKTEISNDFNITRRVANYFYIDESNKKWAIPELGMTGKVKRLRIYKYSDIINFELIEDGNTVTKGGLGRAVAGGVLFGGVGAVIGGATGKKKTKGICSKLQIKITLNNVKTPVEYINLIMTDFKKDGLVYKAAYNNAQEIISILEVILNSTNINSITNNSIADEIVKFKQLLDQGVITEEEFERKKQELLK